MPDILSLKPDQCVIPEGNRDTGNLAALMDSIRTNGQMVPGLAYLEDRLYPIADGVRRFLCCKQLGLAFNAILIPKPESPADIIRYRLTTNTLRKAMTRDEQAGDILAIMESKGFNQSQAAEWIGLPQSTVSSILKGWELDPADALRLEGCPASVKPLIARLPNREAQLAAIDYASKPTDGKLPTRDAVALYCQRLKGDKPPKVKSYTLAVGKRKITVNPQSGDNAGALAKDLKALADKLLKHEAMPPEAWPYL